MHICYQLKSQDNVYAAKNMKQSFDIHKKIGGLKEKPTKYRVEDTASSLRHESVCSK